MTCCWGRMSRPLGAAESNGSDENHHVTGVDQISHQVFGVLLSAGQAADALFQLVDVLAGLGADGDLIGMTGQRCVQQIGLVVDHQVRDVPCLELLCQLPVVWLHPQGAVYHQDGHIGLVQHLEGTLDTQLSQSAHIVNSLGCQ